MISNKEEMKACIRLEWERNMHSENYNLIKYIWNLCVAQTEGAFAYRYLKSLRKYEYATNCLKGKSLLGSIVYLYRKFYFRKLSVKYNIVVSINAIEPGLYLPHIVGGG